MKKELDINFVKGLRKRENRVLTGLVIVEGYPEVKRAYEAAVEFEVLYICLELFTPKEGEFSDDIIIEISKQEFEKIAFGKRLKGILGICHPKIIGLGDLRLDDIPLIMVLEGIEKPGNIGSVLRSSDGAGVTAFVSCDGKTDVYNHNVVRSSIGTLFTVPVVSTHCEELRDFLRKNNISIYVATAHTDNTYTSCNFCKGVALIVGNEHSGVGDFWLKEADEIISIPMQGIGGCLNVAVSASVLMYEVLRQRDRV